MRRLGLDGHGQFERKIQVASSLILAYLRLGGKTMAAIGDQFLRGQLQERRKRLETVVSGSADSPALMHLLQEVDAALERMEKGSFGICEECHETIEEERLIADPLTRFCLSHLTTEQRRALEEDLELAARLQRALLPSRGLCPSGWKIGYHYEPVGLVSGDYCDLIGSEDGKGEVVFLVGDVSGKGVAASMLMTHLHAMFRSLTRVGLPLDRLMGLANRVLCESTMAGQFATLVCGRAVGSGEVEISNAGHCPALLVRPGEVTRLDATGLPLGMFCGGDFVVQKVTLAPGESLFLYTDGLSERRNRASEEYGVGRLAKLISEHHALPPEALITACLKDLREFASGAPNADDVTMMIIRREVKEGA